MTSTLRTSEPLRLLESTRARARPARAIAASLRAAIGASWSAHESAFPLHQSDSITFDRTEPVETECFSIATILDLCGHHVDAPTRRAAQRSLLDDLARSGDLVRFFRSERLPPDADCTAVAALALWELGALDTRRARSIASRLLDHRTRDGRISVYFDDEGERAERVDAVVTCNVLRFATQVGIAERSASDVEQIRAALGSPTRDYPADVLLFAAARLVHARADLAPALAPMLREALAARRASEATSLEQACRAAAAFYAGLEAEHVLDLALPLRDVSRPLRPEPFFSLGRRASYFGSTPLTAAFRLHAITLGASVGAGHD